MSKGARTRCVRAPFSLALTLRRMVEKPRWITSLNSSPWRKGTNSVFPFPYNSGRANRA